MLKYLTASFFRSPLSSLSDRKKVENRKTRELRMENCEERVLLTVSPLQADLPEIQPVEYSTIDYGMQTPDALVVNLGDDSAPAQAAVQQNDGPAMEADATYDEGTKTYTFAAVDDTLEICGITFTAGAADSTITVDNATTPTQITAMTGTFTVSGTVISALSITDNSNITGGSVTLGADLTYNDTTYSNGLADSCKLTFSGSNSVSLSDYSYSVNGLTFTAATACVSISGSDVTINGTASVSGTQSANTTIDGTGSISNSITLSMEYTINGNKSITASSATATMANGAWTYTGIYTDGSIITVTSGNTYTSGAIANGSSISINDTTYHSLQDGTTITIDTGGSDTTNGVSYTTDASTITVGGSGKSYTTSGAKTINGHAITASSGNYTFSSGNLVTIPTLRDTVTYNSVTYRSIAANGTILLSELTLTNVEKTNENYTHNVGGVDITANGGDVILNGNSATIYGAATVGTNKTPTADVTISFDGGTLSGVITLSAAKSFNGYKTVSTYAGTLTYSGTTATPSGVYTSDNGSTINVTSSYNLNGITFAPTSSKVTITSASATAAADGTCSVSGTATSNLTMTGTGISSTSDITVNKDVTVTIGVTSYIAVNASGNTLSITNGVASVTGGAFEIDTNEITVNEGASYEINGLKFTAVTDDSKINIGTAGNPSITFGSFNVTRAETTPAGDGKFTAGTTNTLISGTVAASNTAITSTTNAVYTTAGEYKISGTATYTISPALSTGSVTVNGATYTVVDGTISELDKDGVKTYSGAYSYSSGTDTITKINASATVNSVTYNPTEVVQLTNGAMTSGSATISGAGSLTVSGGTATVSSVTTLSLTESGTGSVVLSNGSAVSSFTGTVDVANSESITVSSTKYTAKAAGTSLTFSGTSVTSFTGTYSTGDSSSIITTIAQTVSGFTFTPPTAGGEITISGTSVTINSGTWTVAGTSNADLSVTVSGGSLSGSGTLSVGNTIGSYTALTAMGFGISDATVTPTSGTYGTSSDFTIVSGSYSTTISANSSVTANSTTYNNPDSTATNLTFTRSGDTVSVTANNNVYQINNTGTIYIASGSDMEIKGLTYTASGTASTVTDGTTVTLTGSVKVTGTPTSAVSVGTSSVASTDTSVSLSTTPANTFNGNQAMDSATATFDSTWKYAGTWKDSSGNYHTTDSWTSEAFTTSITVNGTTYTADGTSSTLTFDNSGVLTSWTGRFSDGAKNYTNSSFSQAGFTFSGNGTYKTGTGTVELLTGDWTVTGATQTADISVKVTSPATISGTVNLDSTHKFNGVTGVSGTGTTATYNTGTGAYTGTTLKDGAYTVNSGTYATTLASGSMTVNSTKYNAVASTDFTFGTSGVNSYTGAYYTGETKDVTYIKSTDEGTVSVNGVSFGTNNTEVQLNASNEMTSGSATISGESLTLNGTCSVTVSGSMRSLTNNGGTVTLNAGSSVTTLTGYASTATLKVNDTVTVNSVVYTAQVADSTLSFSNNDPTVTAGVVNDATNNIFMNGAALTIGGVTFTATSDQAKVNNSGTIAFGSFTVSDTGTVNSIGINTSSTVAVSGSAFTLENGESIIITSGSASIVGPASGSASASTSGTGTITSISGSVAVTGDVVIANGGSQTINGVSFTNASGSSVTVDANGSAFTYTGELTVSGSSCTVNSVEITSASGVKIATDGTIALNNGSITTTSNAAFTGAGTINNIVITSSTGAKINGSTIQLNGMAVEFSGAQSVTGSGTANSVGLDAGTDTITMKGSAITLENTESVTISSGSASVSGTGSVSRTGGTVSVNGTLSVTGQVTVTGGVITSGVNIFKFNGGNGVTLSGATITGLDSEEEVTVTAGAFDVSTTSGQTGTISANSGSAILSGTVHITNKGAISGVSDAESVQVGSLTVQASSSTDINVSIGASNAITSGPATVTGSGTITLNNGVVTTYGSSVFTPLENVTLTITGIKAEITGKVSMSGSAELTSGSTVQVGAVNFVAESDAAVSVSGNQITLTKGTFTTSDSGSGAAPSVVVNGTGVSVTVSNTINALTITEGSATIDSGTISADTAISVAGGKSIKLVSGDATITSAGVISGFTTVSCTGGSFTTTDAGTINGIAVSGPTASYSFDTDSFGITSGKAITVNGVTYTANGAGDLAYGATTGQVDVKSSEFNVTGSGDINVKGGTASADSVEITGTTGVVTISSGVLTTVKSGSVDLTNGTVASLTVNTGATVTSKTGNTLSSVSGAKVVVDGGSVNVSGSVTELSGSGTISINGTSNTITVSDDTVSVNSNTVEIRSGDAVAVTGGSVAFSGNSIGDGAGTISADDSTARLNGSVTLDSGANITDIEGAETLYLTAGSFHIKNTSGGNINTATGNLYIVTNTVESITIDSGANVINLDETEHVLLTSGQCTVSGKGKVSTGSGTTPENTIEFIEAASSVTVKHTDAEVTNLGTTASTVSLGTMKISAAGAVITTDTGTVTLTGTATIAKAGDISNVSGTSLQITTGNADLTTSGGTITTASGQEMTATKLTNVNIASDGKISNMITTGDSLIITKSTSAMPVEYSDAAGTAKGTITVNAGQSLKYDGVVYTANTGSTLTFVYNGAATDPSVTGSLQIPAGESRTIGTVTVQNTGSSVAVITAADDVITAINSGTVTLTGATTTLTSLNINASNVTINDTDLTIGDISGSTGSTLTLTAGNASVNGVITTVNANGGNLDYDGGTIANFNVGGGTVDLDAANANDISLTSGTVNVNENCTATISASGTSGSIVIAGGMSASDIDVTGTGVFISGAGTASDIDVTGSGNATISVASSSVLVDSSNTTGTTISGGSVVLEAKSGKTEIQTSATVTSLTIGAGSVTYTSGTISDTEITITGAGTFTANAAYTGKVTVTGADATINGSASVTAVSVTGGSVSLSRTGTVGSVEVTGGYVSSCTKNVTGNVTVNTKSTSTNKFDGTIGGTLTVEDGTVDATKAITGLVTINADADEVNISGSMGAGLTINGGTGNDFSGAITGAVLITGGTSNEFAATADITGNVSITDGSGSFLGTVSNGVSISAGTGTFSDAITGTVSISGSGYGTFNSGASISSDVTVNTSSASTNKFDGTIGGTLEVTNGTVDANAAITGLVTINVGADKVDISGTMGAGLTINGGTDNYFSGAITGAVSISGGNKNYFDGAITGDVTITGGADNDFDGLVTGKVTASAGTSVFSAGVTGTDNTVSISDSADVTFDGGSFVQTDISAGKLEIDTTGTVADLNVSGGTATITKGTVTILDATGGTTDINGGTVSDLNVTVNGSTKVTAIGSTVTNIDVTVNNTDTTVFDSTETGDVISISEDAVHHSQPLNTVSATTAATINSGTINSLSGTGAVTINGTVNGDSISVDTTTKVGTAEGDDSISSTTFVTTGVAPYSGDLIVNGKEGADTIDVKSKPTTGTFTVNGDEGDDYVKVAVSNTIVNGGADNDAIWINGASLTNVQVNTDAGNDVLIDEPTTTAYTSNSGGIDFVADGWDGISEANMKSFRDFWQKPNGSAVLTENIAQEVILATQTAGYTGNGVAITQTSFTLPKANNAGMAVDSLITDSTLKVSTNVNGSASWDGTIQFDEAMAYAKAYNSANNATTGLTGFNKISVTATDKIALGKTTGYYEFENASSSGGNAISLSGGSFGTSTLTGDIFIVNATSGVSTLENITMDTIKVGATGIDVSATDKAVLKNITLNSVSGTGIDLSKSATVENITLGAVEGTGITTSVDNTIGAATDNDIQFTGTVSGTGIAVTGGTSGSTIQNVQFTDAGSVTGTGISNAFAETTVDSVAFNGNVSGTGVKATKQVKIGDSGTVTFSNVSASTGIGIDLQSGSATSTVKNVTITANAGTGIKVADNATIGGAETGEAINITSNTGTGIKVEGGTTTTINDFNVTSTNGTNATAISVTGGTVASITGTDIAGNSGDGIIIEDGTVSAITNTTFNTVAVSKYGIQSNTATDIDNVDVTGNVAGTLINITGGDNTTIDDVEITGVTSGTGILASAKVTVGNTTGVTLTGAVSGTGINLTGGTISGSTVKNFTADAAISGTAIQSAQTNVTIGDSATAADISIGATGDISGTGINITGGTATIVSTTLGAVTGTGINVSDAATVANIGNTNGTAPAVSAVTIGAISGTGIGIDIENGTTIVVKNTTIGTVGTGSTGIQSAVKATIGATGDGNEVKIGAVTGTGINLTDGDGTTITNTEIAGVVADGTGVNVGGTTTGTKIDDFDVTDDISGTGVKATKQVSIGSVSTDTSTFKNVAEGGIGIDLQSGSATSSIANTTISANVGTGIKAAVDSNIGASVLIDDNTGKGIELTGGTMTVQSAGDLTINNDANGTGILISDEANFDGGLGTVTDPDTIKTTINNDVAGSIGVQVNDGVGAADNLVSIQNFKVVSTGVTAGTGIVLAGAYTTVTNATVTGGQLGVSITGENNTVTGSSVTGNSTNTAVSITGANNTVSGSEVTSEQIGININTGASNAWIYNTKVTANGQFDAISSAAGNVTINKVTTSGSYIETVQNSVFGLNITDGDVILINNNAGENGNVGRIRVAGATGFDKIIFSNAITAAAGNTIVFTAGAVNWATITSFNGAVGNAAIQSGDDQLIVEDATTAGTGTNTGKFNVMGAAGGVVTCGTWKNPDTTDAYLNIVRLDAGDVTLQFTPNGEGQAFTDCVLSNWESGDVVTVINGHVLVNSKLAANNTFGTANVPNNKLTPELKNVSFIEYKVSATGITTPLTFPDALTCVSHTSGDGWAMITFENGTTLTDVTLGAGGAPDSIIVGCNLIIDGEKANAETNSVKIIGTGKNPIFDVDRDGITLQIRNAELTKGYSHDVGGAVRNCEKNSTVILQNVNIHHNSAELYGGAVYSWGPVVIQNQQISATNTDVGVTVFQNNSAQWGGAVYVEDGKSLEINQGTESGIGGTPKTYNQYTGSHLTQYCVQFIGNKATQGGSAIYAEGVAKIAKTSIVDHEGSAVLLKAGTDANPNTLANVDLLFNKGVALHLYGGNTKLDGNVVFAGNTGDRGAGLYLDGGELTTGAKVAGTGKAFVEGANIGAQTIDAQTTDTYAAQFIGNTSTKGGAVYLAGDATLNNVYAAQNQASVGGAIYVGGGSATITGTLKANYASYWGGALYNEATVTLSADTKLDFNWAGANYGDYYSDGKVNGTPTSSTNLVVNSDAKKGIYYNFDKGVDDSRLVALIAAAGDYTLYKYSDLVAVDDDGTYKLKDSEIAAKKAANLGKSLAYLNANTGAGALASSTVVELDEAFQTTYLGDEYAQYVSPAAGQWLIAKSSWTFKSEAEAGLVVTKAYSEEASAAMAYDLDNSGTVDMSDFVSFAQQFNKTTDVDQEAAVSDFDGDGTVTMSDFILFAQNFNKKILDLAEEDAAASANQLNRELDAAPEAAPAVDEAAPAVDEAAPAVDEAAPVVVEAAPVVVEAAPVAVEAAPVVVEAAPVAVDVATLNAPKANEGEAEESAANEIALWDGQQAGSAMSAKRVDAVVANALDDLFNDEWDDLAENQAEASAPLESALSTGLDKLLIK